GRRAMIRGKDDAHPPPDRPRRHVPRSCGVCYVVHAAFAVGSRLMRIVSIAALSVLLLALQVVCSPAFADDSMMCGTAAAADERIAACSRVITAGKGNLSWAYNNRGHAHFVKGDYDHAIADYGEAIRLDPKEAYGYLSKRGDVYHAKGDNDRAI